MELIVLPLFVLKKPFKNQVYKKKKWMNNINIKNFQKSQINDKFTIVKSMEVYDITRKTQQKTSETRKYKTTGEQSTTNKQTTGKRKNKQDGPITGTKRTKDCIYFRIVISVTTVQKR